MSSHLDVMSALIDAGANVDSRGSNGFTPLHLAAGNNDVAATRLLLHAKANPSSIHMSPSASLPGKLPRWSPLVMAVFTGRPEVVRELIRQVGIEGCGGACGGVNALQLAAGIEAVDVMVLLTDAGVVDTERALSVAASEGREASVKFLLRHQPRGTPTDICAYVDIRDSRGRTALSKAIGIEGSDFPRIVRWLMDAGADTSSFLSLTVDGGRTLAVAGSPLGLALRIIRENNPEGKPITDAELHRLEAISRLLLQVEAVHAVSWLWPGNDMPFSASAARGATKTGTTSKRLRVMAPSMKGRSWRRAVIPTALLRWEAAFYSVFVFNLILLLFALVACCYWVRCLSPEATATDEMLDHGPTFF